MSHNQSKTGKTKSSSATVPQVIDGTGIYISPLLSSDSIGQKTFSYSLFTEGKRVFTGKGATFSELVGIIDGSLKSMQHTYAKMKLSKESLG